MQRQAPSSVLRPSGSGIETASGDTSGSTTCAAVDSSSDVQVDIPTADWDVPAFAVTGTMTSGEMDGTAASSKSIAYPSEGQAVPQHLVSSSAHWTPEMSAAGRDNFARLELLVGRMDWVWLGAGGHVRARYDFERDASGGQGIASGSHEDLRVPADVLRELGVSDRALRKIAGEGQDSESDTIDVSVPVPRSAEWLAP